jgi:Rho-binding antiterminator
MGRFHMEPYPWIFLYFKIMEPRDPYAPVACDFHDQLEAFATTKNPVRLAHRLPDGGQAESEGLIVDLYTNSAKEEYLKLADGTEIRLDHLIRVTPREAGDVR